MLSGVGQFSSQLGICYLGWGSFPISWVYVIWGGVVFQYQLGIINHNTLKLVGGVK